MRDPKSLFGHLGIWVFFLGVCVFVCLGVCEASAQETAKSASVSEEKITELRSELAEGIKAATSIDVRRACKGVVREAQALIEELPEASNRFDLLCVVFEAQKRLLSLEATQQNREAIFETCRKLLEAPDQYAKIRFEADMLLMEKKMSESKATTAERVTALKNILKKYHGTSAEWKSLVVGSMIATKLFEFDLDKNIQDSMLERFAGDHNVIQYRREKHNRGEVDAIFAGTYKTSTGSSLTFPYDLMGHQYVLYFWSQEIPGLDKNLAEVKKVQDKYPGRFIVFSFNLDELPDAGEKQLRKLGLDWTTLHLPGGRNSSTYRAYAERDPNAIFVNGQGHVLLVSPPTTMGITAIHGVTQGVLGAWNLPSLATAIDDERYLAQLRYLFIGDWLLGSGKWQIETSERTANPDLEAIRKCFIEPPFRYRLTQKESLENYSRAEKLCSQALKKNPKKEDDLVIRNHRIIALIGMWNLAREPKYLEEAVTDAKAVLASNPPAGADLVARFCLAKQALREGSDPEIVTSELIKVTGGTASALATGAILALEGNARTAHNKYRDQLLDMKDIDPSLWAVRSFLMDLHHRYRNFWASPGGLGFGRPQKYAFRNTVGGLGDPMDRGTIDFSLEKLGGGNLRVPKVAAGKMLAVIFVEPPAEVPSISNLVARVNEFGNGFSKQGVDVVVAFLSDDTNVVSTMAGYINDRFQIGMLENGLKNPLVQRLGILWADRGPNLMLFRPDGRIAWLISGLKYRAFSDGGLGYPISLAIMRNIEKVRADPGFEALEKGDYKKALELLEEPIAAGHGGYWCAADRLQGRALAYMGLKDWKSALTEIDAAIDRRKTDFKSGICKCHGLVEMYLTKATILEKLGRSREAKIEVRRAEAENLPHAKLPSNIGRTGVPVGVYYDWLKRLRLGLAGSEAPKIQETQ